MLSRVMQTSELTEDDRAVAGPENLAIVDELDHLDAGVRRDARWRLANGTDHEGLLTFFERIGRLRGDLLPTRFERQVAPAMWHNWFLDGQWNHRSVWHLYTQALPHLRVTHR